MKLTSKYLIFRIGRDTWVKTDMSEAIAAWKNISKSEVKQLIRAGGVEIMNYEQK